jgi:hypothetical protein
VLMRPHQHARAGARAAWGSLVAGPGPGGLSGRKRPNPIKVAGGQPQLLQQRVKGPKPFDDARRRCWANALLTARR